MLINGLGLKGLRTDQITVCTIKKKIRYCYNTDSTVQKRRVSRDEGTGEDAKSPKRKWDFPSYSHYRSLSYLST